MSVARTGTAAPSYGWPAAAVIAVPILAYALARSPWLAAGAAFGGLVLVLTLVKPLPVLGAMLMLGAIDLSFLTGGFKGLFEEQGGLDANGIRLIGIVVALIAIAAADREVVGHALSRFGRWYLVLLLYAAATLVLSPDVLTGLRLLLKLAYPFMLFIGIRTVARSESDLARLGDWTLIGAAGVALVLNPVLVLVGAYEILPQGRLQLAGLYGNPLSFYLLAMLLLASARFALRRQVRYLLLGAALAPWMVLSVTRITLGATVIGFTTLAVLGALVTGNRRILAGALLVPAVTAAVLLPLVLRRTFGYVPGPEELIALAMHPSQLVHAMNWEGRLLFWAVLWRDFLAHLLFGSGLGASTAVLAANFPKEWGTVPHNEYLRVGVETGIAGLVLFAVLSASWLRASARAAFRGDALAREYALAAFATIAAAAVIGATDNALDYYAAFTQYIGFYMAGAIGAWQLARAAEPAAPRPTPGTAGEPASGLTPA